MKQPISRLDPKKEIKSGRQISLLWVLGFILTLNSVNYYYACYSNNLVRLPQDQTVTS